MAQHVFVQNTEPTKLRPGIMWVDTTNLTSPICRIKTDTGFFNIVYQDTNPNNMLFDIELGSFIAQG